MKNLAVLLFSLVIVQGCSSIPSVALGSVASTIASVASVISSGSGKGVEPGLANDPSGPSSTTPRTSSPDQGRLLLSFSISYKYRGKGGRAAPQELTERSVLHSGDTYKIQFTPDEDCYVYIFQYDSSLKLFTLFPREDVAIGNPVRGGQTYTLPANNKSYQLDTQRGTETIHFLAYRQPNETLESEYQAMSQAYQTGNEPKAKAVQGTLMKGFKSKGLAGVVKDGGKVSEKSDESGTFGIAKVATFSDSPDSGDRTDELEMCEDCISSISFKHQ
jgi:hypothetical protein